jgi:PAS domain S-box-containing protein
MASNNLLTLHNLSLFYGNLMALKSINLEIKKSEIHAIVGEHGAGKSSLANVISGFLKPTSGKIQFKNNYYNNISVQEAKKLGIEIITQNFYGFNFISIANNLFINSIDSSFYKYTFLIQKKIDIKAQEYLDECGFNYDPTMPFRDLSLSDKVAINILSHVYSKPNLLILDEALEKLSQENLKKIISILKELKKHGTSILFITHRIDDIFQFADKVTILRNGEILHTDSIENINKVNLVMLAYTQITNDQSILNSNKYFNHLLKFNETILEDLPINILVVDQEHKIQLVNEFALNYFKQERNQMLNEPFMNIFPEENKQNIEMIEKALSEGKNTTFDRISLSFKNSTTVNNIKIVPTFDNNRLIGNIVTIEDITAQENLRNQIILSEKLSSAGLLAAGVAHEINDPLEVITNYLQFLKFKILRKDLIDKIDLIENEVLEISQIISNLLTFSDDKKKTTEDIELNLFIDNLINLIKYNAKYKRISINFIPANESLILHSNKMEIKEVILNLIKNSFDAMEEGGNLTIKTDKDNINKRIYIYFEDTGKGIPEKNIKNIFLPFFSTKNDTGQNMGLGLSITYSIVQKYNGEISVKNLSPYGCQFIINFPLVDSK